jgi:hypothetical protein
MRYGLAVAIVSLVAIAGVVAADPSDRLAARRPGWQKWLDGQPYRFSESSAGMLRSLAQYTGDCKVHMVYGPKAGPGLTYTFERDGKVLVTIHGHTQSAFRTHGNILYFADVPMSSCGCMVLAYDLTTGKKLWESKLSAVGTPSHSAYTNQVTMELSDLPGKDRPGEAAITITGRESYGDYVEIIDEATGQVLAHKIYRQGF